jgi:hypothetical protein
VSVSGWKFSRNSSSKKQYSVFIFIKSFVNYI